jgi:hypothetical protein
MPDHSRKLIALAGLLLRLTACLPAWSAPAALPDQNGGSLSLADYPGQAVLVIVVSGRKLRHIKKWEQTLRSDFPDLVSLRVADITDDPRPTTEQVATKLRKRAPADVSVLIDLANTWATEYELDTTEPCLLLFDGNHAVVAQFRGRANRDNSAAVIASLQAYFNQAVDSGT